jgi:hypothetical protein
MIDARPVIVTVQMDETAQAFFDDLRTRYFPSAINFLKAHLTLFHNLPGAEADTAVKVVADECAREWPMLMRVAAPMRLGRGVAFRLDCDLLTAFRARLAERFAAMLSRQDREAFRPHVTVQNKVAPHEAEALFRHLSSTFKPFDTIAEGAQLWRYEGGPWAPMAAIPFQKARA